MNLADCINRVRWIIFAGYGVLLTSCATTQEHRIRQYGMEFQAMETTDREAIREGRISTGYTPLQVYLALGPPNRSNRFEAPEAKPGDIWTYMGAFHEGQFQSSYDWKPLSSHALHKLVVTFGDSGVADFQFIPLGSGVSDKSE